MYITKVYPNTCSEMTVEIKYGSLQKFIIPCRSNQKDQRVKGMSKTKQKSGLGKCAQAVSFMKRQAESICSKVGWYPVDRSFFWIFLKKSASICNAWVLLHYTVCVICLGLVLLVGYGLTYFRGVWDVVLWVLWLLDHFTGFVYQPV